jgi:glycosyltransferase involved in cell wall biosynthesis
MNILPLHTKAESLAEVSQHPTVAVVIACFDDDRWDMVLNAVASARAQTLPADFVFVVVDHNEPLRERLEAALPRDVVVMANRYQRGAGGARNTAALHVDADYLAFLDDDAEASSGWLEHLMSTMQVPGLVGAGGTLEPWWETAEPSWFPSEFAWVVGGTTTTPGHDEPYPIRNVWSANLIVDRLSFVSAGGFRANFGKVGKASEPEDTELCLRLSHLTGQGWAFVPLAGVRHHVPASRALISYFVRRCWLEGRGKAALRALSDHDSTALSSERSYLTKTLPRGFFRYLGRGVKGEKAQFQPAGMLMLGAVTTCAGYGYAVVRKASLSALGTSRSRP